MRYRWRDLAFDVEDTADDRTLVVLALPGKKPNELDATLVVSEDRAPHGAKGYADEVLREQAVSLSGFRVVSRQNATVGGKPAIVVDASLVSPEGGNQVQKQAFVEREGGVVVLTGTCRDDKAATARLGAAFERLLATLTVGNVEKT